MNTTTTPKGSPASDCSACVECGCTPPGHRINCATGNEKAKAYQSMLARKHKKKQKPLCCSEVCGHREIEHKAFDQGLRDGENGIFETALIDPSLRDAWQSGNSVGRMNKQNAERRRPDGEGGLKQ